MYVSFCFVFAFFFKKTLFLSFYFTVTFVLEYNIFDLGKPKPKRRGIVQTFV